MSIVDKFKPKTEQHTIEAANNDVDQTASYSSGGHVENASVVQIRLDTQPVLEEVRSYLTGLVMEMRINPATQVEEPVILRVAEPVCNNIGVQRIMQKLRGIMNQHLSQGDVEVIYYYWIAEKFREEIPSYILTNRYIFEISEDMVNEVINNLIWMVTIFLTQAINGGTRNSLSGGTFKVTETRSIGQQAQSPKLFI
jgi:hypothetical protein